MSLGPAETARPGALSAAVARNTALNSLRFAVAFVAALGTSVLVARILGPHDFGVYRLAMGLLWGLEVISVLAVPNAVTRFVAEGQAGDRSRFTHVVGFFLAKTLLIYALAVIPLLGLRHWLAGFYREAALDELLVLGALGVLPGVVAGVLSAAMRGQQRFRELNRLAVLQSLIGVGATALLLGLGGSVRSLFLLAIALNVATLALTVAYTRDDLVPSALAGAAGEFRTRMLNYGIAMGVVALLGAVVWERSEIFFLGRWSGAEEVGFYSLAYTLALQARRIVPTAVGEALFPVFSRLEGLKDEWGIANASMQSTRYLAIVGFPIAIGGAVLAPPLVRLLFGSAYLPAAPVLAVLLVSAGVVAVAQPAAAVIVNKERYRFLILSTAGLTVVNVALDVLLIPTYAAIGAAVANTIVQIAAAVAQLAFVARLLRVPLPLGDLARCLGAALVAAAPAMLVQAYAPGKGLVGLALTGLAFLIAYPFLLARSGVLSSADFERLQAAAGVLPPPFRGLAGLSLTNMRSWAR